MAYDNYVRGTITITPPIPFGECEESSFAEGRHNIFLHTDSSGGTELRPDEDECRYYDLEDHLTEFIGKYPNHTYGGYLVRSGEEQGDVERYTIKDGRVITEKARLIWPDNSNVEKADLEDTDLKF